MHCNTVRHNATWCKWNGMSAYIIMQVYVYVNIEIILYVCMHVYVYVYVSVYVRAYCRCICVCTLRSMRRSNCVSKGTRLTTGLLRNYCGWSCNDKTAKPLIPKPCAVQASRSNYDWGQSMMVLTQFLRPLTIFRPRESAVATLKSRTLWGHTTRAGLKFDPYCAWTTLGWVNALSNACAVPNHLRSKFEQRRFGLKVPANRLWGLGLLELRGLGFWLKVPQSPP